MDYENLLAQKQAFEKSKEEERIAVRNRMKEYSILESMVWDTVKEFTGIDTDKTIGRHIFFKDDTDIIVMFIEVTEKRNYALEINLKDNKIYYF